MIKKISFEEYKETKWSGGLTSEILIYPESASVGERNFSVRISTATTEIEESTFSDYSGFTRFISTLDNPMKLLVNGKEVDLEPFEVFKFSGKDEVKSFGKVRDFNLIYKDGLEAELRAIEKNGEKLGLKKDKTYLLTAFSDGKVNGEEVKRLDSILLEEEEELSLEGKFFLAEFRK